MNDFEEAGRKAMQKARETAEKGTQAADETMRSAEQSYSAAIDNIRNLNVSLIDAAQANVDAVPRPGPYALPISGDWLPNGANINRWQEGRSPISGERSAIVEACVSAYAQTCAMLPGDRVPITKAVVIEHAMPGVKPGVSSTKSRKSD